MNILELCGNGALVLAPTKRLERQFISQYAEAKSAEGVKVWTPPAFTALTSWVAKTWLDLQDSAYPLAVDKAIATDHQILALWAKAIEECPLKETVLSTTSLALSAADAHKVLRRWDVSNDQLGEGGTTEIEQFTKWRSVFNMSMLGSNWVENEGVTNIIIQAIQDGAASLPENITLYAFDEIPPLTQKLFNAMQESGSKVIQFESSQSEGSTQRVPVRQRKDQIEAAALWAKSKLESNPGIKIGIVCPELSKQRREVSETFAKVFEPQYVLPTEARYTLPFNFSAGIPLSDITLVRDAIDFLALGISDTHITEVSKLLRSPYIVGHIKEFSARSKFDERLKARGAKRTSLAAVVNFHGAPTQLKECIARFLMHTGNHPSYQKPSQWAVFFSQALEKLGWPGDRQLDSEEYQALLHWHSVLDQLSKLDLVTEDCSYNRAVSMLHQILVSEVFQPQTDNSPIQILGVLEASGLKFDATWVMDMNDDIWPATAKPSAFIPLHLQKSLNMPHASADRELDFAKRMVSRLKTSSDEVVFSYAEQDDDRELRCSSIIEEITLVELSSMNLAKTVSYSAKLLGSSVGTTIVDGDLAIANGENVRGGTGILKSQQDCPFQAFAKYRLRANEDKESQLGLSPIERGDVVHLVMEHIWKCLPSHQALTALSEKQRADVINEGIDNAFFWLHGRRGDIGPRFMKIERDRLFTLIGGWLDLEAQRTPFKVVSVEKLTETTIGRLPIRMKIDRVDEVNGKKFYIDYKTGRSTLSDWNPEALKAPQVPIYAVTNDDPSLGAAIGQIREGEHQLKGISDYTLAAGVVEPGKARANLPSTWEETKLVWKDRLENVANEFMEGNAAVSPRQKSICQNCHLAGLCRKT